MEIADTAVTLESIAAPLVNIAGVRQIVLFSGRDVQACDATGPVEPSPDAGDIGLSLLDLPRVTETAPRRLVVRGDKGTLIFKFFATRSVVGVRTESCDNSTSLQRVIDALGAGTPQRDTETMKLTAVKAPLAAIPRPRNAPTTLANASSAPAAAATQDRAPRPPPSLSTHSRKEAQDAFARLAVTARKYLGARVVATYFRATKPGLLTGYEVADNSTLTAVDGRLDVNEVAHLNEWLTAFIVRVMKVILDFDAQAKVALGDTASWLLSEIQKEP